MAVLQRNAKTHIHHARCCIAGLCPDIPSNGLQVFKYGPQDALLLASTLKQNADGSWTLDQGNICYNTDHAFIYLQSNCSEVRVPRVSFTTCWWQINRQSYLLAMAVFATHPVNIARRTELPGVWFDLQPISATVTLDTVSYAGETCVVVEGHALGVAGACCGPCSSIRQTSICRDVLS